MVSLSESSDLLLCQECDSLTHQRVVVVESACLEWLEAGWCLVVFGGCLAVLGGVWLSLKGIVRLWVRASS